MKKQTLLSIVATSIVLANEAPKEDVKILEKALSAFKVKGQIRAIYQTNSKRNFGDLDGDGNNDFKSTGDFLVGGKLGIETNPVYDFSIGATFYTSQPLSNKQDYKDGDYYTGENKGYSLLGELYAKYANNNTEIKIGRMELDLPLANSDDIRMIPNLYTAAILNYKPIKGLSLTAGAVTHMAGWENGGEHTKFAKMGEVIESTTSDNGGIWDTFFANNSGARESKLYLAGATYEQDIFGIQAWYGRQSEIMNTLYIEANAKPFDSEIFGVNLVGQYMKEKAIGKLKSYSETAGNEISKIDGNIYGVALELESKAIGVNASFAYNKSGRKDGQHSNGGTASFFGGGKDPLLTSTDVETANGEGDIKAYKGEIGYDFAKVGIDGLGTTIAHAYFDKKASNGFKRDRYFDILRIQ